MFTLKGLYLCNEFHIQTAEFTFPIESFIENLKEIENSIDELNENIGRRRI